MTATRHRTRLTFPAAPAAPAVEFAGGRLSVRFDRFDLPAYDLFLKVKRLPESAVEFDPAAEAYTVSAPARFAPLLGVPVPPAAGPALPLWPALFPDQAALVAEAVAAKRYAVWSQCGNGKTLVGLEFARLAQAATGGRVLVVTLKSVVGEWAAQAARFYGDALPLAVLGSRADMKAWMAGGPPGVAVTNYEKWNPPSLAEQVVSEARSLAGVVLDESSRLKGSGGKQKWALIKSCKGVEYKLALTATPAPNDTIEFASQASFLEKMRTAADIIWTYFTRDPVSHRWAVKPHARQAFFEFMSSWSVYVNDPARYGWDRGRPPVPPPDYVLHPVDPTAEQRQEAALVTAGPTGQMTLVSAIETNSIQRAKLAQVAQGFRYAKGPTAATRTVRRIPSAKPAAVAAIVRAELAAGRQVLVWTVFDAETQIVAAELAGVEGLAVVTGSTARPARAERVDGFVAGRYRVLVSRARMLGYGQNFQCAGAMVFSGWTDSFEDFYQAVRRAVRFGQADRVRVHLPYVRELEEDTLANVRRKETEFERSVAEMEACYLAARKGVPR